MNFGKLEDELANIGLEIGLAVRERINSIPRYQRGDLTASILKPDEGPKSKFSDAVGEKVGFEFLEKLSKKLQKRIKVIVNTEREQIHEIGNYKDSQSLFTYFDAVDGTIKVAGLGNDPKNRIYRLGNNGCWATGIAFTLPTRKDLSELLIKDFQIAAVVDGNPTRYRVYPTNAVVLPDSVGKLQTYERDEGNNEFYKLGMSTQTNLTQATILFDAFQAYDRKSAKQGSEELAVELFRKLINRNEGGAFDIVRMYANLGELLRQNIERREFGYEPQSVGSVTINENLPNLIPITPLVEGAGGYAVDFDGKLIREKKIKSGRQNVIVAANPMIKDILLKIVKDVYVS